MKLSFAHIVLNITDIKRSREFWEKILVEFNVIDQSEDHVGYSNGAFSVWLTETNMKGKRYSGQATDTEVGVHHFAWKVETLKELQEWEAHLRSAGVAMSEDGITDDDFGGQGLFFRDPDSIRCEIHLN